MRRRRRVFVVVMCDSVFHLLDGSMVHSFFPLNTFLLHIDLYLL